MRTQIENSFDMFKKIGEGRVPANYNQNHIKKEIDQLIKNNMLEAVFDYMDSGYELNKKQLQEVSSKIMQSNLHYVKQYFNHASIVQILQNKENDFIYDLILNNERWEFVRLDSSSRLSICFNQKISDPKFQEKIKTNWLKNVEELAANNFFYRTIKDKPQFFRKKIEKIFDMWNDFILKDLNMNDFFEQISTLEKIKKHTDTGVDVIHISTLNNLIREFKTKGEQQIKEEMTNKQNKIKGIYSETNINQLLSSEMLSTYQNKKVEDLPISSQEVLNNINHHFQLLTQHEKLLTIDMTHKIELLMTKKLPEIINKYLNIDNDYRETMTNSQGKNAQELMLESLTKINTDLELIREQLNEDKVRSLSATTRHIKNI